MEHHATSGAFIHSTAEADAANVGPRSRLWHLVQLLGDATVGADCTLGRGAFVGSGTRVGDRVKIGNGANLFGATIEDDAFIAPMVCLLEDPNPRAVNPDGSAKGPDDFVRRPVVVRRGASIGAGAIVLPGVTVGPWAMVGAGAVVHRDVEAHGLVAGNPGRAVGYVCRCGLRLDDELECTCGLRYLSAADGLRLAE